MELETIKRYIGKRVFLTLKNGFKYKVTLDKNSLTNKSLTFPDLFNNLISVDIEEINYIAEAYKE